MTLLRQGLDAAALGAQVRRARRAMGLRQDELAAAAGVGLRFLVELERGKPTVQLGKVLDVLAAAGLDLQLVSRAPVSGGDD
ncbi:transcriptional regulator [Caulobacter vibrioides]|uniref:HipB transcriptional regulator n=1 Tax=Caulobacter vibrioides (strain NA1000 / CB15N) TaxID=565050 RepID=A0A0H3C5I2_CAUVN|nr:type II toxin-antitoxin system Y4mF family antitoxin [Caulobacter vibrioides]YP_002515854.3 HipB transcriptional regulator [Caulobacter vibrioides NA1000]ACL93946.3 HipB transcriptional regulator [Caulobacter vibrioides NA1000]ATC27298.1 transcriptional regulator [Caulobacter vibrioides]AZH11680.1 transcriptional regulator [Caulobacter vibrioides]